MCGLALLRIYQYCNVFSHNIGTCNYYKGLVIACKGCDILVFAQIENLMHVSLYSKT